jgi:AcrR family transcriptional regulator
MKVMSTPYETGGRSAQKARTRDALVAAARDLVAAGGGTPTVEDAAAAASISRSTAYRYFPSKRALLVAAHPEIAASSMLPANPPQDPAARLDAVVRNFTAMILDTEAQQRTMLRLSLEADAAERDALPLRQGRAIAWIAEALDGVRGDLSDQQFRQLVLSIRATIGIEAIVWLVDVAGLSRNDAMALTRWSAQALLQRATTVPPPTPSRSGRQDRPPRARTGPVSSTSAEPRSTRP